MNNNLTTIYIARHGQTDWNLKHKVQGHADIPLNKSGEEQAKKLALDFKNIKFDHVFSSDLVRAKRTAEIIALEKELAVETTKLLREITYGIFEGFNSREFYELFVEWQSLSEEDKKKHPKAKDLLTVESPENAMSRLITFMRETALAFPNQNILIISHGGLMINLLIHLGYVPENNKVYVNNAAYIKLESDGIDFFIKEVKGVEVKANDVK